MKVCAIIPAAGRGVRLGLDRPKILTPLTTNETIWDVLRRKLLTVSDHIHIVLSPEGEAAFLKAVCEDPFADRISTSVQPRPIGMGDAIFRGYDVWSAADTLLVVWGDQVFVSEKTLANALHVHENKPKNVIIPVVSLARPYVAYEFGACGRLLSVRQSREGEYCKTNGWNDIGTFVLSVDGLKDAWERYLKGYPTGNVTGEINFLPFLPFLSNQGWQVHHFVVDDVREARGINTPHDLAFFQELFAR